MRLWISSQGSWPSFHLGQGCIESSGKAEQNPWSSSKLMISDIPMPLVSSGVENGNLRELALARMKDFGAECRDVRYREVGVSQLLLFGTRELTISFTRFTTASVRNRLNCSAGIMPQMADGKPSSLMKIPRRISWLVCSDSESALRMGHSERSWWEWMGDVRWSGSCMSMVLPLQSTRGIRRSSSIR